MKDFAVPSRREWAKWFPDDDVDECGESMLNYLRYVVVEVVTDSTTVEVVKWMHKIVNSIVDHLHAVHHPTADRSAGRTGLQRGGSPSGGGGGGDSADPPNRHPVRPNVPLGNPTHLPRAVREHPVCFPPHTDRDLCTGAVPDGGWVGD